MGYEGWLSLAGTEIVNNERVRTYASLMMPALQMPYNACSGESPGALHRMLDDEEYRSPLIDDAPWIDHDDPDTYDFCGVFGLSLVGLDSTRTATVVEHTGDGGGITGKRKGTRSIRVSALLLGATQASIEAGHAWLSSALEGDCDGDCNGSDLCYLQALTDPEDWGDYISDPIAWTSLEAVKGHFSNSTGRWTPSSVTEELRTPKVPLPLPCDEIIWEYKFKGLAGTRVALRSYGDSGKVFEDWVTIDSDGEASRTVSDRGLGSKLAYSALRLEVGTYVDVTSVTVSYRDTSQNSACFDHYMRQVRECSPIDGPTTVEEYALNSGAMRKVEFTLASGKSWIFGKLTTIAPYTTTNLLKAGGDQSQPFFKVPKIIPLSSAPSRPTLVVDPDCPKVPAPPRPKASFTQCGGDPTYDLSYGVAIPGSLIPLWHDVVPWVSLFAGEKAAKAVRVRFFPRPLGELQDVADLDEASACGGFVVDYIPAHGYVKLDGANQRAYAKQPGKKQSSGDHLLSGLTKDELFHWPVLTCGTDYVMVVDVDGSAPSLTSLTLAVTPRY